MATLTTRGATCFAQQKNDFTHLAKPLLITHPPQFISNCRRFILLSILTINALFTSNYSATAQANVQFPSQPEQTLKSDFSSGQWVPVDNLWNDGNNVILQNPFSPPPTSPFSTNFRLSVFGQRMVQVSGSGNIGTATGDRWNSIGDRLPFATSPGFSSSGLRSQWDGFSANFGVSDDPIAGSTVRHGLIQWQEVNAAGPAAANSRLRFVFRDGNLPPNGAFEYGSVSPQGNWGFGLNNTNPLSTVDVKSGLYVGSGATVSAPDGAGYFNGSVRVGDDAFVSGASVFTGVVVQAGRRIGIGTNQPLNDLDILNLGSTSTASIRLRNLISPNGTVLSYTSSQFVIDNLDNGTIRFRTGAANVLNLISSGNVGVGTIFPVEKLHVDGNIIVNGNVFPSVDGTLAPSGFSSGLSSNRWSIVWAANGTIQTSDIRAKQEIESLKYGLNEVMKLNPISYRWKKKDEGKRKLGFSAQELNSIITEVVIEPENKEELLGVKYAEIIPVLVNAIKEQQGIIEKNLALVLEMESKINALQQQISMIALKDRKEAEIILYQNEPNPSADKTTIRYAINTNFMQAKIDVCDDKAQLVTTYTLPQKQGQGVFEFNGENLRKGVYSYTLIVDGKNIDTKKLLLNY